MNNNVMYSCWLKYDNVKNNLFSSYLKNVVVNNDTKVINTAIEEIKKGVKLKEISLYKDENDINNEPFVSLKIVNNTSLIDDGYMIKHVNDTKKHIIIEANNENGLLYGVFNLLRLMQNDLLHENDEIIDNPSNGIRMINQWDNMDGTVERGYAGSSIFFQGNRNKENTKAIMEIIGIPANSEVIRECFNDEYDINSNTQRLSDYARILASVGINRIVINNTNVHKAETELIENRIDIVKEISDIFNNYGIKVLLSINFASPITLNYLDTSDPLNVDVISWWEKKIEFIYKEVPTLGGFMVKADSEGRPGPFTYNRNHADGANMFARILKKYDGILIWRCFVYNCKQDWRDYNTDRAKAAYDNFNPLDGQFLDNVYLQIKNGPMDFQIREPISPLFGAMDSTNKLMELQITQEYTGQQKHVCFLVPMWKEALNTNTYADNKDVSVAKRICGIAGISNVGSDDNWTGHFLAQANLYGFGRLCWNTELTTEEIINDWVKMTFGCDESVLKNVAYILSNSWKAYEDYSSPLGIGWMVSPANHYGPDVDGYEFSPWGTYNRADCKGLGIDRTIETGTKYSSQYNAPLNKIYNDVNTCPEELLLFFHHVPYDHVLKSGQTVIQYIYDSHFEGYEFVEKFIELWSELKDKIDSNIYESVNERLNIQLENAAEWRDRINTYFYRMSGIKDKHNRRIY